MTDRPSCLLVVRANVAPEQEEAFNRWYTDVHLPDIVGVPGVRSGRRYRLVEDVEGFPGADVPAYLAVYELDAAEVVASPEFLAKRGWGPFAAFVSDNKSAIYELLAERQGAPSYRLEIPRADAT
jgi:hypothetical protein